MADPVKLCKDCKHFVVEGARCAKDAMKPDYVFGTPVRFFPAQATRETERDCGASAKWWEPK